MRTIVNIFRKKQAILHYLQLYRPQQSK